MVKPKILFQIDAPHWACMNVARDLTIYSKYEYETRYYWLHHPTDINPEDYDLIYIHSGSIITPERLNYLWKHAEDTRWVLGVRGSTMRRKLHNLTDFPWAAYTASNRSLLELCPEPAYLCHSGVDTHRFTPRPFPTEFILGWCGTASKGVKRWDDYLKLPFNKTSIGALPYTDGRRGTTRSVPHHMMPDWFAGISVYVSTSIEEGSPLPPKEAAACGRPVAAVRAGDLPEWMPEEYLVEDYRDLVPIIRELQIDRTLLESEGKRFRDISLICDYEIVAQEYDKMFKEVLE